MSYILDALRRAESERSRSQVGVPGLNAQHDPRPVAPPGEAAPPPQRSMAALIGIAAACAAVVALAGSWWLRSTAGPDAARDAAQVAQAPAPAGLPANPQPPLTATEPGRAGPGPDSGAGVSPGAGADAAIQQAPAAAATAAPVLLRPDLRMSDLPSGSARSSAQGTAPAETARTAARGIDRPTAPALPAPSPNPPRPAERAVDKAPAPTAGRAAPAPARPAAPPAVEEELAPLSEAERRTLPPLVIGGAVHSPDPNARVLIVNGQVYAEGQSPAPGVVLLRIGPKRAVFSSQGRRFELPY